MLKPQDIVVGLAILINKNNLWRQSDIAMEICISASEVNMAIKRLVKASLLSPNADNQKPKINVNALQEFLIHGIKYVFPADIGAMTRGIPTSYAAPIFEKQIRFNENDIPVWPDPQGNVRGYSISPLYSKVSQIKNQKLYDFLCIIDAIRSGRARERKIAVELLEKKLNEFKST